MAMLPAMHDDETSLYRLIFLDLDGTLVDHGDAVSPRTLAALNAAQQLGCVIVICTGRNRYMVEHIAAQWSGHGYGIFSNGAVIAEWETGHVLQKIALSSSTVREAARLADTIGASLLCFGVRVEDDGGRSVYTDRRHPVFPAYAERHAHRLVYCDDLRTETDVPTVSVGVFGSESDTGALALAWQESLGSEISVYHAVDKRYNCWCTYMNARSANKAHAAQLVAEMLGIARERTLAVGDHLNDLELLAWAGMGICMGDGHRDVRAQADHVTGTQAEDGVAQAIERFVLGKG
ncbi:MAG: Cof-type HAD-IIB family hydrolase [Janthinobacterium lividum]